MGDESTTPLVMEFIRASEVVITVHQARSHDEFRSPDLNFTVYAAMTIVSQMEGSGKALGRRGIGDAPIFFVPAIVIRLARLGQKLEAIGGSALVVRRMDVSNPAYLSSCSQQRGARKVLV